MKKSVFEVVPQRRHCLYALHFTTGNLICQQGFAIFLLYPAICLRLYLDKSLP